MERTLLDKVYLLHNAYVAQATQDPVPEDFDFEATRIELLKNSSIAHMLPDFVRRFFSLKSFWPFIKQQSGTYAERRQFIGEAFAPLINHLELGETTPSDLITKGTLEKFDPEHIAQLWQKALERRTTDPEGAITSAKSMLESVCKYILDERSIVYGDNADLPKLWYLCSEQLNLAPAQHQEKAFKDILGSCQNVINTLANIRNKIGDAHGQGKNPIKPARRHAELVVNMAGTMATFIVETHLEKAP